MFKLSLSRFLGKQFFGRQTSEKQNSDFAREQAKQHEFTALQLKEEVQKLKTRVEKETASNLFQQTSTVKKKFQALLEAVNALENARVNEQATGFKIAVQEKKNFLERFNTLTRSFTLPESETNALEFTRELNQFVKTTAKSFSDNKYLYAFYRNEARAVGEAINALNATREELEQTRKQGETKTSECEALLQKISRLEQTRASASKAARETQELSQKIEKLQAENAEAEKQAEHAKKQAQRLQQEIQTAQKNASTLKQEAYNSLAPLERPLRKIQKNIQDKHLSRVANACSENFLKEAQRELSEQNSLTEIIEIAALLENKIKQVARDEKEEDKILKAINALRDGSVEKTLRKALEFEAQVTTLSKQLQPLQETITRAENTKKQLAETIKQANNANELYTHLKKNFQLSSAEASEEASALFGERIVLKEAL